MQLIDGSARLKAVRRLTRVARTGTTPVLMSAFRITSDDRAGELAAEVMS